MSKKMTKRDYYKMLLQVEGVKGNTELENFIKHEIELVDRKNVTRKPTKEQIKNENIKIEILNLMGDTGMTVTNICKELLKRNVGDFATQKISALMRALVLDGKVNRVQDKRVTLFTKI